MLNYDGRLDDEPFQKITTKSLTPNELDVMNQLVNFWNSYLLLPNKDENATQIICQSVNTIQGMLAIRVAKRNDPDVWR